MTCRHSKLSASDQLRRLFIGSSLASFHRPEQSRIIWTWIAYGILHLDACSRLQRLELSMIVMEPEDRTLVQSMVTSPHPGKDVVLATDPRLQGLIQAHEIPLPPGQRLFVSLREKPKLRVDPNTLSPLSAASLESQAQWEVLVMLSDWVCINVPGGGLAWVSTDSVTGTTTRPSCVTYAADLSMEMLWTEICSRIGIEAALTVNRGTKAKAQALGHLLTQLRVSNSNFTTLELNTLLKNCPRLTHLEAADCFVTDLSSLAAAYRNQQSKISFLIVTAAVGLARNWSRFHNHSSRLLQDLTAILAHPSSKWLRELGIYVHGRETTVLAAFAAVCRDVNKTMEVLRVHSDQGEIQSIKELHGQDLGDWLPVEAK